MKLTIRTAEQIAAEAMDLQAEQIKAECRARIFAVVDEIAQVNLAAAAAASMLSDADVATYRDGLGWIANMRAHCGHLIQGNDGDWPAVPAGVDALAARY
jgi:hypothetical protein